MLCNQLHGIESFVIRQQSLCQSRNFPPFKEPKKHKHYLKCPNPPNSLADYNVNHLTKTDLHLLVIHPYINSFTITHEWRQNCSDLSTNSKFWYYNRIQFSFKFFIILLNLVYAWMFPVCAQQNTLADQIFIEYLWYLINFSNKTWFWFFFI